ncbi:DUF4388 domain-containing protein [candidate division TA06 bacterium]|nr:DUF4388 domain-containing protein [candidate division TA06 bacterium]
MEIQGQFKGFVELAEIFQTLFAQEKTGVLTILQLKSQETISFQFQRGKVAGAIYGKEVRETYFWDYFVRTGELSSQDFIELKNSQMKKGRPIEGGLIESRVVTSEGLRQMARFYVQSVLDRLFTWKEGAYRFESRIRINPLIRVNVSLDIQPLTMEAVRRKDEWPNVESTLTDENLILLRKEGSTPSEGAAPEEKRVLSIVNGKRTLKEISETSGIGQIGTYHIVFLLLDQDLVEKGGIKAPKVRVIKRPYLVSFLRGLRQSPYWIGLLLFFLINLVGGFVLRQNFSMEWGRLPLLGSETILPELQEERVSTLLDQYLLKEGGYPERLEDLSSFGWFPNSFLKSFDYQKTERGFVLKKRKGSNMTVRKLWIFLKQITNR